MEMLESLMARQTAQERLIEALVMALDRAKVIPIADVRGLGLAALPAEKYFQKVLVLFCLVCIIQLMEATLFPVRASGDQGLENTMSKSYYAADNHYGSETDLGFSNTWYVIAFPSAKARDAFVSGSGRRSTRSIKASEISGYGSVSFRQAANGELEQVW